MLVLFKKCSGSVVDVLASVNSHKKVINGVCSEVQDWTGWVRERGCLHDLMCNAQGQSITKVFSSIIYILPMTMWWAQVCARSFSHPQRILFSFSSRMESI